MVPTAGKHPGNRTTFVFVGAVGARKRDVAAPMAPSERRLVDGWVDITPFRRREFKGGT
jgi:hypothetical protein